MTVMVTASVCKGGFNLISPALAANPGSAAELLNFEIDLAGTFRRIEGYERYDGKRSPSSGLAEPWVIDIGDGGTSPTGISWEPVTVATGPLEGTAVLTIPLHGLDAPGAIEMAPGGEFGLLVHDGNQAQYTNRIYPSWSTFVAAIQSMAGVQSAEIIDGFLRVESTVPMIPGVYPRLELLSWKVVVHGGTEEDLRAAIEPPPGIGPIYGLAIFKRTVICARDHEEDIPPEPEGEGEGEGEPEGDPAPTTRIVSRLYRATPNGWELIPMPEGTFRLGGATYQFTIYNFTGSPDNEALYGVDGKNKPFEITGKPYPGAMVYAELGTKNQVAPEPEPEPEPAPEPEPEPEGDPLPLEPDPTPDPTPDPPEVGIVRDGLTVRYPILVAAHSMHLFLAFEGGWVQYSGLGNPHSANPNDGAGGIAFPGEITNLLSTRDNALAVTSERNEMWILYGTSEADWQATSLSNQGDGVGGIRGTLASGAGTFVCDTGGIFRMEAIPSFGNFATTALSRPIAPLYNSLAPTTVGAVILRDRGIYRVYYRGGQFISMTFGPESIEGFGFGKLEVPIRVVAAGNVDVGNGNREEAVFIGGENGMVYRVDKGRSFDGEEIESFIRFNFNHADSPRQNKRWRKAVFDIKSPSVFPIRGNAIFNYGGNDESAEHDGRLVGITKTGGEWNVDHWGFFDWSETYIGQGEFKVDGHGRSVSMALYSKGKDPSFVIEGYTMQYSPRRLVR